MALLYRARLIFLISVVFAVAAIAVEFPLSELLRQRSELSALVGQLTVVQHHNAVLQSDISTLSEQSTIVAIAHQDYGLVRPGQRSFVILPGPDSSVTSNPLTPATIPAGDLVAAPTSASVVTPPSAPPAAPPAAGSLWQKVLNHLEFWR